MTPQSAAAPKKAPRSSNLELFRVLVMLSIVAIHYVVNSGLTGGVLEQNIEKPRTLFLLFAATWGHIGINCFVMITGYFMCKSEITMKKFLKLFGTWYFYKWTIAAIFYATGYVPLTLPNLFRTIVPFTTLTHNFVSCFVVFFLFIPYLNVAIRNMSEKMHLLAIGTVLLFYSLEASIPGTTIEFSYVFWFGVIYLIAAYLRLYPKKHDKDWKFWFIVSAVLAVICAASVLVTGYFGVKYLHRFMPLYFVAGINRPLAIATAVAFFMLFKNLPFPQSKFVNILGGSTFAVLLIHAASDAMREWLWKDTLDVVGHFSSPNMYAHFFLSVFGIFFACVFIDQFRIALVEKPFFKWYDKREPKFQAFFARVGEKVWKRLGVEEKQSA